MYEAHKVQRQYRGSQGKKDVSEIGGKEKEATNLKEGQSALVRERVITLR